MMGKLRRKERRDAFLVLWMLIKCGSIVVGGGGKPSPNLEPYGWITPSRPSPPQLDVKGCRNCQESFSKYVEFETMDGDNQYKTDDFGLQVWKCGRSVGVVWSGGGGVVWYGILHPYKGTWN